MERWTISKFEFLLIWGVPTAFISIPIGAVAWLLNWLTGGAIQQIITTAAIAIVTVFSTLHVVWILLWTDIRR